MLGKTSHHGECLSLSYTLYHKNPENVLIIKQKLTLGYTVITSRVMPGYGNTLMNIVTFALETNTDPKSPDIDYVEGEITPDEFDAMQVCARSDDKSYLLTYYSTNDLNEAKQLIADVDVKIDDDRFEEVEEEAFHLTLPMAGVDGFGRFIRRFAAMLTVIESDPLRQSIGDYVKSLDEPGDTAINKGAAS